MTIPARVIGAILALIIVSAACSDDATLDMQYGYPDDLVIYEDGSGYSESADKTWDEGTFRWDCATMGNKVCG